MSAQHSCCILSSCTVIVFCSFNCFCCCWIWTCCGICFLFGSSLDSWAVVCMIAGRLSEIFAAYWATMASLCVYETAGMCSVPPGGGGGDGGVWGSVNEACCDTVGSGWAYWRAAGAHSQSGRWPAPPKNRNLGWGAGCPLIGWWSKLTKAVTMLPPPSCQGSGPLVWSKCTWLGVTWLETWQMVPVCV